jgi:LacI family transcriptional regulator
MTTRKEVAEVAGVSEATVSRVLNNTGPIKEITRRRVLLAAKELGYQLNAIAANLARGRSRNLGVVLPYVPKVSLFSTYYFPAILDGIGEAVRAYDYGLLLLYRDPLTEYDYGSLFRTRRTDACIVIGASSLPTEEAGLLQLVNEQQPCCVLDQHFEHIPINTATVDHHQGSRIAVQHLINLGHKRIGFLNGSMEYSNSLEKKNGYMSAIQDAGLEANPRLLYEGNYSRTSGYTAAAAIHRELSSLDAMFIANDRMAIGLMQGLRELGCTLPRDLPIVAYDDSNAAVLADTQLTTVQAPLYDLGKQAAEMLLQQLETSGLSNDVSTVKPAVHICLPTKLIVRQSCGG